MRILTTLTAAVTLAAFTTAASAGGLSPEIMEAPVVAQEAAPAGSSINPAFIVVGVLAALLIASSLDDDEEDVRPRQIEDTCTACDIAFE
ncbi:MULTISPECIES: hypothetical protein [unclassified Yoonia]|uniref:hypothetical protein n=1 Tax=unclassified Yoonia TaxID=2629118 RepID=UPI002AFF7350|nr:MULTISPECIES: hypothetical protein [unclassified Yoonia]